MDSANMEAWTEFSSEGIHNCFHHCGFQENFSIENDLSELKNTLKAAIEAVCDVPEDLDAEIFAYFDNNLIVSEKLLDTEIIFSKWLEHRQPVFYYNPGSESKSLRLTAGKRNDSFRNSL